MRHHDHSSNRLRAFTLIELLVAITIIGILVSLLLPAISSVRSAAKKTDCMNRQRQLSVTMLRYVGDHKGSFPFYTNSAGSGSGLKMWYNIISDDWNRATIGAATGSMQSFDANLIRNFFCSEDPHQRAKLANNPIYGALLSEWGYMQFHHLISIGYNKRGLGERQYTAGGASENFTSAPGFNRDGSPWDPNNPTGMARLATVYNPSETIMIGDSWAVGSETLSGTNSEKHGHAQLGEQYGAVGYLYPRHNRGMMANITCVDGRVISLKASSPYNAASFYTRLPSAGGVGNGDFSMYSWWDKSSSWWDR